MDYNRNSSRRGFDSNRNPPQTNRFNSYNDRERAEPDWESSFSQILTRTKQNINRVNEKYGTSNSISARPGYNDFNHPPQTE